MDSKTKILTSIKISKSIHQQLIQAVVISGYGLRGKTKWIIDAIETFLKMSPNNFAELVDIASEITELSEVISIRLPAAVMRQIEEAVIIVRKIFPSCE